MVSAGALAMAGFVAIFALGVSMIALTLSASNFLKRVVALTFALIAASVGAVALGAGEGLAIGALALALATLAVGAALSVRVHEAYGVLEARSVDETDEADDDRNLAP